MIVRRIFAILTVIIICIHIVNLRFSLQYIPKDTYKSTAQWRIIYMSVLWWLMAVAIRHILFSPKYSSEEMILWLMSIAFVIAIYLLYLVVYFHYRDVVYFNNIPSIDINSSMFNDNFTINTGVVVQFDMQECFRVESYFAFHDDCQIEYAKIKFWQRERHCDTSIVVDKIPYLTMTMRSYKNPILMECAYIFNYFWWHTPIVFISYAILITEITTMIVIISAIIPIESTEMRIKNNSSEKEVDV